MNLGQMIWALPVPVPVGGAPPAPVPPIDVPLEPDVTPVDPSACSAGPVSACLLAISTTYYASSYTIITSLANTMNCTSTTACNPIPETSTSTVSYTMPSYQTISSQNVIVDRDTYSYNSAMYGDADGMAVS